MRDLNIQTVTGRIGSAPLLPQGRAATILVWPLSFYFPKVRAIRHLLFSNYSEDKGAKDILDEYFYRPKYLVAPMENRERGSLSCESKLGEFLELIKVYQGRLTIVYRTELDPYPWLKGWRMFHEL